MCKRKRIMGNKEPHASSSTRSHTLTPLQVRILAFVTVGATDEEIAEKLHVSVQYIKNQIEDIFAKIGTSSRLQTTLWALTNL
jgi:LuxR family transcriptional regulator of csgAB operon